MPHDLNGNLLKVGDRVTVEFEVVTVYPTEELCNCTLATVEPMYPGEYKTSLTINTRQAVLVPVQETANA